MNVTTIGIDLAKTVFSIHGTNQHGKVVVRKRLNRPKLLAFFALRIPANVTGHSGDRDRFAHGHHAGVSFVL